MAKVDVTEQAKQKLAERERCRKDKMYLAEVLGYDFVESVHRPLFDTFIAFDSSKPWERQSDIKRRLVLWPRSHFKSSAAIVEIISMILNFPDCRILLMRGSVRTTQDLLGEIAAHFLGTARGSRLTELFPEFCSASKKALQLSANSFVTPARVDKKLAQATVTVASPRAIKTGSHFSALFADDLVNESNFRNPRLLQKTIEDFYACIPLLDNLDCYVYTLGTRYAFGDLYETILRKESEKAEGAKEWKVSIRTCWADKERTKPLFPQQPSPRDSNKLIGFTAERLLQLQRDDPGMFSSQYLNQPAVLSSNLFTDEKMMAAVIAEQDAPALSQALLFVDLASTTEFYSDDSVILAMKIDHLGRMYLVDGIGDQWAPGALAVHVITMALKHRPLRIMFEKTASCLYFTEYLRTVCRDKGISLPIDFIKVDSQPDAKNLRICATEGYIRNKRLLFFAGLPCWDKLTHQIKQFPKTSKAGHDDYPDTLALGVRFLTGEITPTVPLSESRNAFLKAIELHEQQEQARSLLLADQLPAHYEGMGSEFD